MKAGHLLEIFPIGGTMTVRTILILLGMGLFLTLSCSDNTTIINSTTPQVNVSGTVYAWRCGVGDQYNNGRNNDQRITSLMGEKAKITFLPKDGVYFSDSTDDSSSYNWPIEQGTYNIILETGFNWPPDTIKNVVLNHDTTINLNFVLDFLVSDTIQISFFYVNAADSLGFDSEKNLINRLSYYLYDMLEIDQGNIPIEWRKTNTASHGGSFLTYVRYYIPIRRDQYNAGYVCERAHQKLGIYRYEFPIEMEVMPAIYICLW